MLKTIAVFIVLSLVGIFFQSSFLPEFSPAGVVPDFILVLVVWISLFHEEKNALWGAFFLGLLSDFSSGMYIGPQASGCILACVFVRAFSRHIYADRFLSLAMVTFIVSLIKQFSARLLVLSFIGFKTIHDMSLYTFFVQALLTSIVAPVILRFILAPRRKKSIRVSG
jgi:rod shape-determining protein MreD